MTTEQNHNDADLATAIAAVKDAITKLGAIGARNDGELCSSLVGIQPALSVALADLQSAQVEFHDRLKFPEGHDEDDEPEVAVPDHEVLHEDGRREQMRPRLGLRRGRGGA